MTAVEAYLRRERIALAAALLVLAGLAWAYLWDGAGMGMSALDMTSASLFPHLQPDMGEMDAPWPLAAAMWAVMMVAMMTPSAAPMVLLYGRVLRHRGEGAAQFAPPLFLLGGYLAIWLAFAVAAATLQGLLQPAGLISSMMLWSKSAPLSAAVLAAAGVYQLTPLKRVCLAHCRGPVQFLMQYWMPGRAGALLMGVRHGAYCVGCCWVLMLLLFVGGVMNLVWIAALTILVLVEKFAPAGEWIGRLTGGLLLAWAIATLLV